VLVAISPNLRARAIDQLIDLRRERVHPRPTARPYRQPTTSRLPRRNQPRHRPVIIPPAPPLHAANPSGRTPQGSPSLPPVSSHSPSSDRALTTTHARLPAPQDRAVGRNRGHPWGETMATSGAFRWPPTGSFSWPPSARSETNCVAGPWTSFRGTAVPRCFSEPQCHERGSEIMRTVSLRTARPQEPGPTPDHEPATSEAEAIFRVCGTRSDSHGARSDL
jgi:hypothetical protein